MNEQSGQPPAGAGPGAPQGQPTEAEMQAALDEQMRNIRVEDVVVQTTVTLVNLGARRLGLAAAPGEDPGAERDLGQAQIAIEAVRALLPLLPAEVGDQIAPALSQLQMAFAREAQGGGAAPAAGEQPGSPAPTGDPESDTAAAEEAERAKARAKIWTPGS
ncbi:MAG TPA: hypothetical protein VEW67_00145 [Thermoleophilaceae bacterium]|nr:hypothetical protein [Thermoleophilaceae bacterium]